MSAPLVETANESEQIGLNIGGELFEGVNLEKKESDVREIDDLRNVFIKMLLDLKELRERLPVYKSNFMRGICEYNLG